MYSITDDTPAFCLMASSMALTANTEIPENWNDKEIKNMARWYTEICNTYPNLELDESSMEPSELSINPTIPPSAVEVEAEDYLKNTQAHVEHYLNENPFGD